MTSIASAPHHNTRIAAAAQQATALEMSESAAMQQATTASNTNHDAASATAAAASLPGASTATMDGADPKSSTGGDGGGAAMTEQNISYSAERIIGNGSFGVVFEAKVVETGEVVAIKKVLQDKRFKNRELQIMRQLVKDPHPNIVALRHCFYSQVCLIFFCYRYSCAWLFFRG